MSYLTSLIFPQWILSIYSNMDTIFLSAMTGYFIGKEGGIWKALKRVSILLGVAIIVTSAYWLVRLNTPYLSDDAVNSRLSATSGWFGGGK